MCQKVGMRQAEVEALMTRRKNIFQRQQLQPMKLPEPQEPWTREYVRGLLLHICKHTGAEISIRWPEAATASDTETLTQDGLKEFRRGA